ncbi:MAG TPA: DNA/RNA non-specific endonuclease, partial [Opitutus sp.]|nr:DNA/RNA non-specific endonuclease [Opitutus sp.]
VSAFDVAWDVWHLYYADSSTGQVAVGDKSLVYAGAPAWRAGELAAPKLLVNRGYLVGYSETQRGPLWAGYRVDDLATVPNPPPRPEQFEVDRRTISRVPPDAYTGSGFDRGHLAPNYAIATRYGPAAQAETFLMSNITPQRHTLNAGLWRELERKIATNYPARYGEVWIFVGPVFGERPRLLRGGVAVPEAFFLIVIDEHEGRLRTLALLVPQDAPADANPSRYLTTIAEIQRRTHLDFLHELDDRAEHLIEVQRAARLW